MGLYTLLVKKQRRSLEIDFDGSHTACTSFGAPKLRLWIQEAATLKIPGIGDHSEGGFGSCGLQNRSCCFSAKNTMAVNQLFSENDGKLAKSIKEL